MGRPRCDPFDGAAIFAAIGKGETTPLRAYQDYAATAARPYARASFETALQRHQQLGPSHEARPASPPALHAMDSAADVKSDAFWAARLPVKTSVIKTEADNASLTVNGGSFFVHDGKSPPAIRRGCENARRHRHGRLEWTCEHRGAVLRFAPHRRRGPRLDARLAHCHAGRAPRRGGDASRPGPRRPCVDRRPRTIREFLVRRCRLRRYAPFRSFDSQHEILLGEVSSTFVGRRK